MSTNVLFAPIHYIEICRQQRRTQKQTGDLVPNLKIRCDREIPCGNCKKRGVSSICPEGQLTYGSGRSVDVPCPSVICLSTHVEDSPPLLLSRFVLAGTTELHTRIQELSTRVRKLEAALETAHAQISNDVHPLLREEERVDITTFSSDVQEEVQTSKWEESDTISDKFSMLSIDGDIRTTRFTPSFYSLWYLSETELYLTLQENPHSAPLHKASPDHISSFPTELLHIALGSFDDKRALLQRLLSCLPPPSIAQTLVDA
ncbi:13938_t:CDS:2, partial [Acaulospora colombiana]